MSEVKSKQAIIIIVPAIITLIIGYLLGAFIGFGGHGGSEWSGTYTTDKWNGSQRVSLVLNGDGTCQLPKRQNEKCTYEIRDKQIFFNGETTSNASIGEDGLVYMDTYFSKLK